MAELIGLLLDPLDVRHHFAFSPTSGLFPNRPGRLAGIRKISFDCVRERFPNLHLDGYFGNGNSRRIDHSHMCSDKMTEVIRVTKSRKSVHVGLRPQTCRRLERISFICRFSLYNFILAIPKRSRSDGKMKNQFTRKAIKNEIAIECRASRTAEKGNQKVVVLRNR